MKNKLVSVIVPLCNAAPYIKETLSSILVQTYYDIEIIVIDDHSIDDSFQIVDEIKSDKIRLLKNKGKGASSARNTGINLAQGDYIQFLDADDIICPKKIEKQSLLLAQNDADLSFSLWGTFTSGPENSREKYALHHEYNKTRTGKEMIKSLGEDNWYVPVNSWLIKRDLITKAGFWNTEITNNDDGEFFARVLLWANKVVCENSTQCYYRIHHQTSLSSFNTDQKVFSALKSWILIKKMLIEHHENELLIYPLKGFYVTFMETIKLNRGLSKQVAEQFDFLNKIVKMKSLEKFKLFNFLINVFGLYYGYKIDRSLSKIKSIITFGEK